MNPGSTTLFNRSSDEVGQLEGGAPALTDDVERELFYQFPWFFSWTKTTDVAVDVTGVDVESLRQIIKRILSVDPTTRFVLFMTSVGEYKTWELACEGEFVDTEAVYMGASVDVPMALMMLCDYHVVGENIAAWWGAYLSGDEHVILAVDRPGMPSWIKAHNLSA